MSTPASIAGHPIHPMLVAVPVGLWLFSFISDVAFLLGWGGHVWTDVAFYTMAGGVVGALVAAVPGVLDFASLEDPKVRRIALAHLTMNLAVIGMFSVDLWLRVFGPRGAVLPVVLSGIGVLALMASGWLGAELVYVHGVSVGPRNGSSRKRDRLASSGRRVEAPHEP